MTSIPALRFTQPRGSFIFRSKQKAPFQGSLFMLYTLAVKRRKADWPAGVRL